MELTPVHFPGSARYFSMDEHADRLGFEGSHGADGFAWARPATFPPPAPGPTILPSHPRLRWGTSYSPGRGAGSDYYDVLSLGGNRFALAMAAISGPGAAGAAALIRAAVRAHAGRHADCGSLLHDMNERFRHLRNDGLFATAVCAVFDARRRTVRLACAGHPAPLLARQGASVTPLLVHDSMPLGNSSLIVTCEYDLRSGDRLLFYTDGAVDREIADRVPFSIGRLTSALEATRDLEAPHAADCLAGTTERFTEGREPDADQTLLLMDCL
jgi:serine phosphatase RsbU (regulator of sigma subunit)